MRLAIISDTHGNMANFKKIVNWLNKEKIGLVLHCGDIGDPGVLRESLADFKGEFLGVLGNIDKSYKIEVGEYQNPPRVKVFEEMAELEVGNKKIAIIHRPDKIKKLAATGKYDLVFYGHIHYPWEEKIGNCRLINPGEAAGQIYKPAFAVYNTDTDNLELKILEKLE